MFSRKQKPEPPKGTATEIRKKELTNNQIVLEILSSYIVGLQKQNPQLNPDWFLDLLKLQYNNVVTTIFGLTIEIINSDNDDLSKVAETMAKVQGRIEYALEQLAEFKAAYENYVLLYNLVGGKSNQFNVSSFELLLEKLSGLASDSVPANFSGKRDGKFYVNGKEVGQNFYDMYLKRQNARN